MDNDNDDLLGKLAHRDCSGFAIVFPLIGSRKRQTIEYESRFFKGYPVFFAVAPILRIIPFKFQRTQPFLLSSSIYIL
jgi:hypothetical protein